jgi:hypothetical protein
MPASFLFVATYYKNKRRMKMRFQSFDGVLAWARANKMIYGTPGASSVFALSHSDGSPLAMDEALTIFRALNIPAYRMYQRQTIGNVSFPFERPYQARPQPQAAARSACNRPAPRFAASASTG